MSGLSWDEFTAGARACGWIAYVATADEVGRPHVAVVSPGYGPQGLMWFGTRPSSIKVRNLRSRSDVAFHWPVGSGAAPGECFARGRATLHEGFEERQRVWDSGVMPYDLSRFFGSPEDEIHLFVEVAVSSASILGPDFLRRRWRP